MGTITKALEMLSFFSRRRARIGLAEFVRLTGRDKATVHRHLVELEANGFLERDRESRAYRLGPAILRLSGVREATAPMRSLVRPVVTALAEAVGELAHVSLLQGRMLSPIFHFDPRRYGTRISFDESEMLPLHATSSGLAVLAFSPPAFVDAALAGDLERFTAHTPTEAQALRHMLGTVRQTGCSRLDMAFDEEVSSQGAPIFDASGTAIGALSVAVPAVRATDEKCAQIRKALLNATQQITRSLGGTPPTGTADDSARSA